MTVLKHKTSLKSHLTLITILVFFERTYVVPQPSKVSYLGLNWFRIYGWGPFRLFRLFKKKAISKKPNLVRVKWNLVLFLFLNFCKTDWILLIFCIFKLLHDNWTPCSMSLYFVNIYDNIVTWLFFYILLLSTSPRISS